jgi:hypothetical protein
MSIQASHQQKKAKEISTEKLTYPNAIKDQQRTKKKRKVTIKVSENYRYKLTKNDA